MEIVFLSDTHSRHHKVDVPGGDLLIHGGDVTNGRRGQIDDFLDWFLSLPHPYKLFIGGNMDFELEKEPNHFRAKLPENVHYLCNESVVIEGVHYFGSPMIPKFVGAFNRERGDELRKYWNQIPGEVDVLITHTPPKGILDRTSLGLTVGCADLMEKVLAVTPKYHLFGHVHEAYGKITQGETTFVNGSFFQRFRSNRPPWELKY